MDGTNVDDENVPELDANVDDNQNAEINAQQQLLLHKQAAAVVNEEDYDAAQLEEMTLRSQPRRNLKLEDLPELTIALAHESTAINPSKMIADAPDADNLDQDDDVMFRRDGRNQQPAISSTDKPYGYGLMGLKMQKRMPLKEPYEEMLQGHMRQLRRRIDRKVNKYIRNGDDKRLRSYRREKWALEGMQVRGFEFQTVLQVHERFVRLDLVPTHYNYPEFFLY